MLSVRENWRVYLLVVVLLVSACALFSPTMGGDDAATGTQADQATNLVYGLQLSGGTRIRAPLDGYVAAGVDVPTEADQRSELEATIAENLDGTLPRDVEARPTGTYGTSEQGTIEVTQRNVTRAGFTAALDAAGVEYDDGEGNTRITDTYNVPFRVVESGGGGPPIVPIVVVLLVLGAGGYYLYRRR